MKEFKVTMDEMTERLESAILLAKTRTYPQMGAKDMALLVLTHLLQNDLAIVPIRFCEHCFGGVRWTGVEDDSGHRQYDQCSYCLGYGVQPSGPPIGLDNYAPT